MQHLVQYLLDLRKQQPVMLPVVDLHLLSYHKFVVLHVDEIDVRFLTEIRYDVSLDEHLESLVACLRDGLVLVRVHLLVLLVHVASLLVESDRGVGVHGVGGEARVLGPFYQERPLQFVRQEVVLDRGEATRYLEYEVEQHLHQSVETLIQLHHLQKCQHCRFKS